MFPEFRKRQMELKENGNFQGFSENGIAIFCLFAAEQKQKTNICFHSSTNDKLQLTMLFQQMCLSMLLSVQPAMIFIFFTLLSLRYMKIFFGLLL
jgi:hypothetical protein